MLFKPGCEISVFGFFVFFLKVKRQCTTSLICKNIIIARIITKMAAIVIINKNNFEVGLTIRSSSQSLWLIIIYI